MSDFIRDYLTFLNTKIPTENKVYQEFKVKFPTGDVEKWENNLSSIKKFAIYYNKLLNPEKEQDQEIRLQIEYINRLEVKVAYPFLMKVYDDYSSKVIQKDVFLNILELVQSFVWRRFIIGSQTGARNKIFMKLYDDVNKSDYLASIEKSLLRKKGNQKFPSNKEVINALKEKDVYGINTKNRIYFFERLENFENKELVQINNLTTEHIFPQNPDAKWKVDLNEEYSFIKENYLNTIANLTLSGNNGSLSNKPFIQKRDMNTDGKEQGYKYSRLWLNRYLSTVDKWGKAEIEERFTLIKERFLKVWKFPSVEINESVPDEVNIFYADDPTKKKLEYVIFLDQKLKMTKVSELYTEVMKTLFDLQPEPFFNTELLGKLNLTQDKNKLRRALALNETYFIESTFNNKKKFEQIKTVLTIFNIEDELIIKFK
ncbi:MAG: HNH endonuclease family protein [Candidatus Marithrix sp.]